MRTLEEVTKEYSQICMDLGDYQYRAFTKLTKLDIEAGKIKEELGATAESESVPGATET